MFNKKETLLEKALKIKRTRTQNYYTKEELELAIAFLEGKISIGQYVKVTDPENKHNRHYSVYYKNIINALKIALQKELIKTK
jgi:NAD(P)H-flavin reductase